MLNNYVYIKRGNYRKYLYIVPLVISVIIGILVATSFNTDKLKYFFIIFTFGFISLVFGLYAFNSFAKIKEKDNVLYFKRIRGFVYSIIISIVEALIISTLISIIFKPINKWYPFVKLLPIIALVIFITILIYVYVSRTIKVKK